jgi:hypothetical protein
MVLVKIIGRNTLAPLKFIIMSNNLHQSVLDLLGFDKSSDFCLLIGNIPFYGAKFKKFLTEKKVIELLKQKRSAAYIMRKTGISRSTEWRLRKKHT